MNWTYEYTLSDHLGNNRVTFKDNGMGVAEAIDENHYYPYGMLIESLTMRTNAPNNDYLYNGKELDVEFGLDLQHYGARLYDGAIARFSSVDPLAEQMSSWSPYNYTFNNPIRFIDPDGMAPDDIIDIEKSTGNITVTAAAGDDVVRLVDNGTIVDSHTYGKNGSFSKENQIYELESDFSPGVTSTVIMGTNEKALQPVYKLAAGSDVEFGKLDVSSSGSPFKSFVVSSHEKRMVSGLIDLVKTLSTVGFKGIKQSHSHPGTITTYNESIPSGYYDYMKNNPLSLMPDLNSTGKLYGDAGNAAWVRSKKGFKNTKFEVYAPGNKTTTIYDGINKAKIIK